MPYPVPENEAGRNAAVRSYRVMDSAPEVAFDEITDLAARICQCPVAYVSFIEEGSQSFKAAPREIGGPLIFVAG